MEGGNEEHYIKHYGTFGSPKIAKHVTLKQIGYTGTSMGTWNRHGNVDDYMYGNGNGERLWERLFWEHGNVHDIVQNGHGKVGVNSAGNQITCV